MEGSKKHQRHESNTIDRNLKWLWCGINNAPAACVWSRRGPPAPDCQHTTTWKTLESAARLQHVCSHTCGRISTQSRRRLEGIDIWDVQTIKVTLTQTDKMMAELLTDANKLASNRAAANIKETSDRHYSAFWWVFRPVHVQDSQQTPGRCSPLSRGWRHHGVSPLHSSDVTLISLTSSKPHRGPLTLVLTLIKVKIYSCFGR